MIAITPGRIKVILENVVKVCSLEGDMAELGVFQGDSAKIISESCPHKKLHLYDTFTGIPEDDMFIEGHKKGDFNYDLELVKDNLKDLNVEYHVGYFPETFIKTKLCFVHVDGDLYKTTLSAIQCFYPCLVTGGIMVFDDYGWKKCPGVKLLVDQYFVDPLITPNEFQCIIKKGTTKIVCEC